MIIHVLSDLHIEFEPFDLPETKADLIVLAGDIHIGEKGVHWAKENIKDKPVIYVLGNHEYFGNAYPKLLNQLKTDLKGSNIHLMENDEIEIEGIQFYACTFWTDFELYGDPKVAEIEAAEKMVDYKKIRVSPKFSKIRPIDTSIIHKKSVKWFEKKFGEADMSPKVVITHHAPSKKSVPNNFSQDILSASYASNCEELVNLSKANLWIHGHIHSQLDYHIGNTRVVCNPRGYPDEPNDDFQPTFCVEI